MKGFDALIIGAKPKPKFGGGGGEDDEEKSSRGESLGDAGGGMAIRAFAKALGVDPEGVDVKRAAKALKAAILACKGDEDEDEEY